MSRDERWLFLVHQLMTIDSMGQSDESFGATVRTILRSHRSQMAAALEPTLALEGESRPAIEAD